MEKVLLVHNYYQLPGGEDTVVANEKQLLEDHGHMVILYSRNNSELKTMNLRQRLILPLNVIFNIKTYREIRRIILENKIDIVHVHNTLSLISPSVYYAAISCKVPVVQTIHNFRLLCPNAIFFREGHVCEDCVGRGLLCAVRHNCYRNSKSQTLLCTCMLWIHRALGTYGKPYYICLTEFNRTKLLNLRQIRQERIFVKPNYVKARNKPVLEEERKNRFIYVGRLESIKGVEILLKAWKAMGEAAPELLVCGNGPLENWCRDYVSRNKLRNVVLAGFVPNTEILEQVAVSKALILPTQCYEGFPMTILEAFSVGTPVICSDFGNVGALVQEGVTGCKFQVGSADELQKAVRRICTYNNLYESTYAEYQGKYTEEENYRALRKIYAKVKG